MSDTWLFLTSGPARAAFNMALDEALLEAVAELGHPVLRAYQWSEPAATFGYFQRYADVERMTPLRPLIRRPTGGGLVLHANDWTYSLVFPPNHAWYSLAAVESYRRLHEWIAAAFALLGLRTQLAAAAHKDVPGACFAGPEQFDLLLDGRKVAGAAQRRASKGLLIQGSIQPLPENVNRAELAAALCRAAHYQRDVAWVSWPLPAPVHRRALSLAATKYSRPEHNGRR